MTATELLEAKLLVETCRAFKLIDQREIDRVFRESKTASAELDHTFMCFEEIYYPLSLLIPKDWTVIDFGCSYGAQSIFFRTHKRYIGIDSDTDGIQFQTENSIYHKIRIQDYIEDPFDDFLADKVMAICSAVPDREARELVSLYLNHCVWYPGENMDLCILT